MTSAHPMTRLLLLALAANFFCACDGKPDFLKTEAEKATPIPTTPKPTPPKGDWMWKDNRTLLDPKKKK